MCVSIITLIRNNANACFKTIYWQSSLNKTMTMNTRAVTGQHAQLFTVFYMITDTVLHTIIYLYVGVKIPYLHLT